MNDDSGVSRAEPTFALGEVVAERYMIARFIAQGGMGEVYEADDLELNERVALKVVKAEFEAGDEAHERFRREVQLARRVTHPNVCRLYDLVRAKTKDGREVTFLTMEFLPGETLAERLRRVGRLGTRDAMPLVRQMASALDAAHKAGVIHRDFKTANVVLVPDAAEEGSLRAVVTDFGLARAERRTGTAPAQVTGVGLVVGTASYMSPEQAEGADVTPATDVYSLGVVLYEMVTGALPHAAHSTLSMLLKRLREPAPSPRELVPDIDPRWEATILRCLERVPSRRFARPRDVARALEGRGEDESSASDARVTREMDSKALREAARLATPRPGERVTLPRRGLLVAGAALVLALFAAVFVSRRRPAALPFDSPNPVQLTTSAGLDVFPSFSPDGESIAYASDESGGFSLFVKQLAPGGRSIALTPGEDRSVQPSWSPDGARIAYHSDAKGGIWIIPALGGTAKQLVDFGAEPSFSPDGKEVVFSSDSQVPLGPSAIAAHPPATLFAVPADGGVPRRITRPGEPQGGHGAPVFTPDGASVVFTASTNQVSEIWSVEIATGKLTRLVSGVIAYDPVVTPDGRAILYSAIAEGRTSSLFRLALRKGGGEPKEAPEQVIALGIAGIRHLALSRDGRRVAYAALTSLSRIEALPLDPVTLLPVAPAVPLTSDKARNSSPAVSPNGKEIAFIKWFAGTNADIWLMRADGTYGRALTTDPGFDSYPSWFPAGDKIAFHSRRTGKPALFSVETTSGKETLLFESAREMDFPRVSPDGKRVAFNSRGEGDAINVFLADVATGQAAALTHEREAVGYPAWSPDGRWLAVQVKKGEETHVGAIGVEGGSPEILTNAKGEDFSFGVAPDGDRVSFAGFRGGLWDLYWVSRRTKEERKLTANKRLNSYVRYPVFSPTGSFLAYEEAESAGNIWMIESKK